MAKFDAQTMFWIKTTLSNDEYSSDEEMVEYFIKEGPMTKEEAEKWVKLREFYWNAEGLLHKSVRTLSRKEACPHCEAIRLSVVIHRRGWFLECPRCGDVLSEKEQHAYAMEPTWVLT